MKTYKNWKSSYDKWSGDLWGRLIRFCKKNKYDASLGWFKFLWNGCAYCSKYEYCDNCPLNKNNACYGKLVGETITYQMYCNFIRGHKKYFIMEQKVFLKILRMTKFED